MEAQTKKGHEYVKKRNKFHGLEQTRRCRVAHITPAQACGDCNLGEGKRTEGQPSSVVLQGNVRRILSEVDPKSLNSMLAMLVGKPMDLGGRLDTALPPGAPTRTCWAEGTGQSPCRNGGRGEVAGGCGT